MLRRGKWREGDKGTCREKKSKVGSNRKECTRDKKKKMKREATRSRLP